MALLATVRPEAEPAALPAELLRSNTPALTATAPVKLLLAVRVSVAAPVFVKPVGDGAAAEMIWDPIWRLPIVSISAEAV